MPNLIALAAFAFIVACAPASAPTPAEPAPVPAPAPAAPAPEAPQEPAPIADEASCKTAGGDWRPICRMQNLACVITYADAGKACTDGDDCTGNCIVKDGAMGAAGQPVTGVCSTNSDPCGCRTMVEDGKATATLCVD
jgi:hypothetical protein